MGESTNLIQSIVGALKALESVIYEVEIIANQVKQGANLVQTTRGYAGVWNREAHPRLMHLEQIMEQENSGLAPIS